MPHICKIYSQGILIKTIAYKDGTVEEAVAQAKATARDQGVKDPKITTQTRFPLGNSWLDTRRQKAPNQGKKYEIF